MVEGNKRNNYFNFRPVVQMSFKYISIFNSGSHFIQWSNFCRGQQYKVHLYGII